MPDNIISSVMLPNHTIKIFPNNPQLATIKGVTYADLIEIKIYIKEKYYSV